MDRRLSWSREALDDVESIFEFIRRDSPFHARQVAGRLFELAESAALHPLLGRNVPELRNPAVRERFGYSYRLIYEVGNHDVRILAVIHGNRLLSLP
jgi:plasmid stabilization system protein ParE